MEEYRTLLDYAETVARAAGERLREGSEEFRTINFEDRCDVKLQADVESEKLIRNLLTKETDYPIVGEEEGGDASLTKKEECYWVVDPLDGTYNYLRNIPQTCVSIGLMRGMNPVLGVIYDFNREETFSAIVGAEFMINRIIHKSVWAEDTSHGALATGLRADRDFSSNRMEVFIARVQRFKKIRQIGSAALGLAYVAAGRFDAYFEEGIRLWDIAAGLALVKSAGGVTQVNPRAGLDLCYDVWAAGRCEFIR